MARAVAGLAILLLAGCAIVPVSREAGDWPARRLALQALSRWELHGRIAVAAGGEGFSGGFRWRQDGSHAEVDVRTPLGGTALTLSIDGSRLTVADAQGQVAAGAAADAALAEALGVPLPVAELRYWLVGAPAPGAVEFEQTGPDGRLERLVQSGWELRYDRYREVGAMVLPARLELMAPGARVRVVTGQWQMHP
ncbi:MAG: outer membrane lipoprotein LolB [Gammaproteobacteria bacterium]|nr:outer membrane lipoprotein LolB [Gammaproteobacteria bacterium]